MKIAWVCPKPGAPSGGVWFIHRLAALADSLVDESWLALTENFDVWWDANPELQAGTYYLDSVRDADVVILPEGLWDMKLPDRSKAVCFMQNYIWLNKEHFLFDPGPMITCSRFMSNYAQDVLGVRPVGKLTPYLDDNVWYSDNVFPNSVLLMARRTDIANRLRNVLEKDGYPVYYIDYPISQKELAKWLSISQYYVHIPSPEGFPMAALEAMRSKTAVVGTTGGGGNEFMFHKRTAYVVQDPELGLYDDKDEYIRRLKSGLDWMRSNPDERAGIVTRAYDWSLRYTAEATKAELREVLEKLNA